MCCVKCSGFIESPYSILPHEDLRLMREEQKSEIYGCQRCFTFFEFTDDAIYLMETSEGEAESRVA
ncbi:hypothetical protein ACFVYJ_00405 [Pontibacter sp. JAM-7]|uniref:hypothetical protein n=1 Tax=Pontibacter sp. JAM-7 TaxID=3366581 RepID=UPI003AF422BD